MNTLDELIKAALERSRKRMLKQLSTPMFDWFMSPEYKEQCRLDMLEQQRIEKLLELEYGPAIIPTNPWWECDCA